MEFHLDIGGVAHGGHGVGRIDGQVCFVPFGLPGDRVRVVIEREQKGVLWGRIVAIEEPSPHRAAIPCGAAPEPGSCMWSHFAYPAQAAWKQQIVRDCFSRIGQMGVEPTWYEVSEYRLGYRTRAEFQVHDGAMGYYRLGTHDVVDVPACPLSHPRLNEALAMLRQCAPKVPVEITVDPEGSAVLVWTRQPDTEVAKIFPDAQHLKSREARAWFCFDGVPVVNGCFSQSSLVLNRLLQAQVRRHIGSATSVLDIYCGSGNFSLTLPADVEVQGIDHNRAAVFAADTQRPGAYRAGDTGTMAGALAQRAWHTVILDPPRAGAKALIPSLAKAQAQRIVYVSCDPATLARDARTLAQSNWHLTQLDLVDMFPHTPHVESVCVFDRA